jgi:hypothetical protein
MNAFMLASLMCMIHLFAPELAVQWGFWAHKRINRLAVHRLPLEMQIFYKKHIDYLTENAVNPDRRRYAVIGEAERHFIDLDSYPDSLRYALPRYWQQAKTRFTEDSLRKHGINPWYVQIVAEQLTEAFKAKNAKAILRLSADLGHYVADAHVPLHTTRNYNGQLSQQEGIHGFWESRLPELFAEEYDLWIGEVQYVHNIAETAWKTVFESHLAKDSVLLFEQNLSKTYESDQKYSYELRNNILTRTYSKDFSAKYHQMLKGQVERRMKMSVKVVADLWYTCWVNAGQPVLGADLIDPSLEELKREASSVPQNELQKTLPIRLENDF